jgi:hypothetical protein
MSERASKVALCDLDVTYILVAYAEIMLPEGVPRIGLRQTVGNRVAVAERLERAGEVALCELDIADPVAGHREIAIGAGSSRGVAGAKEGLLSLGQRASRHPEIAELDP